jgi:hypothetical protein
MVEEVYLIMDRMGISMVVGALFAVSAAAQSQAGAQAGAQATVQAGHTQAQAGASGQTSAAATAQNGQANAGLTSGTAFNAALSSPVDAKKCKPGDAVNARTTEAVKSQGRTVIPKGAKLVGHVTQASSRAKGETKSVLGIVFDKAILSNGQEIPLNVAIRALASAGSASMAGGEMDTMGGLSGSAAGGPRAIGGVTSAAGGAVGTVTNTAANVGGVASSTIDSAATAGGNVAGASRGAIGGLNAAGQLTSNSQGVFGLNGLNLSAAASNSTEGVITSAGKNVHLESGTRMLLVTEAQAGTASESKPAAESNVNPKSKEKRERDNPEKP